MSNDEGMPPVGLLGDWAPFESPQHIPGAPHNLPPPIDRPGQRQFYPVGAPGGPATPAGPAATPVDDPYRYATLNGETVVAVGTASIQVLAEPASRRNILGFRNSGATNLFIAFGNDATTNSFLRLAANVMVLFDTVVPQDDVYCISDAVSGQLTLIVGNYNPAAV